MSCRDYPLQSNEGIRDFFNKNYDFNYLENFSLPYQHWKDNGADRVNSYKINLSNRRGDFSQIFSLFDRAFYSGRTLKNIYVLFRNGKTLDLINILKRRRFPKNIRPYGGGQWWSITMVLAAKVCAFLDENPNYLKYHKYSLLPDEMFFQSIIMSLAESDATIKIINKSLTYVNWTRKDCSLPVTFETSDLEELEECGIGNGKLFARKFDVEIMNVLDYKT